MATYIFDLQSPCQNGQNYQIDMKIQKQSLPDNYQFDKSSNDLDCEKRDHHSDSPFVLNSDLQSKRFDIPDKEICYRVNNGEWKRVKAVSPSKTIQV